MGVPGAYTDHLLLREHAYYDTGDIELVVPQINYNPSVAAGRFVESQIKGLGLFDYQFLPGMVNEDDGQTFSFMYMTVCILIFLTMTIGGLYFWGRRVNNFKISKSLKRPQTPILPISNLPSLSNSPEMSELDFPNSPPRNFKFNTLEFDKSFKSWAINDFEKDLSLFLTT